MFPNQHPTQPIMTSPLLSPTNERLRLYTQGNTNLLLCPPRPHPFFTHSLSFPTRPLPPHFRLHPPLLPAWPGFPLSGRKRRHRTIFTEAQLREVKSNILNPQPQCLILHFQVGGCFPEHPLPRCYSEGDAG